MKCFTTITCTSSGNEQQQQQQRKSDEALSSAATSQENLLLSCNPNPGMNRLRSKSELDLKDFKDFKARPLSFHHHHNYHQRRSVTPNSSQINLGIALYTIFTILLTF